MRMTTGDKDLAEVLKERGVEVVTFDDWRRLDVEEKAKGAAVGKPREKVTGVKDMLDIMSK